MWNQGTSNPQTGQVAARMETTPSLGSASISVSQQQTPKKFAPVVAPKPKFNPYKQMGDSDSAGETHVERVAPVHSQRCRMTLKQTLLLLAVISSPIKLIQNERKCFFPSKELTFFLELGKKASLHTFFSFFNQAE